MRERRGERETEGEIGTERKRDGEIQRERETDSSILTVV